MKKILLTHYAMFIIGFCFALILGELNDPSGVIAIVAGVVLGFVLVLILHVLYHRQIADAVRLARRLEIERQQTNYWWVRTMRAMVKPTRFTKAN